MPRDHWCAPLRWYEVGAAGRIVLVGPMGCGKSTVGTALADITGWPYLDNDALLIAETGFSAREILCDKGADALHVQESRMLRLALAAPPPLVIGVAASTVDLAADRELLLASGHVVWKPMANICASPTP